MILSQPSMSTIRPILHPPPDDFLKFDLIWNRPDRIHIKGI